MKRLRTYGGVEQLEGTEEREQSKSETADVKVKNWNTDKTGYDGIV